ncbi:MAG: hypothetical protein IJ760_07595 [Bacteroidales bacterium]|nr:hypothetical protein [Bacteroidales bacterium]
MAIKKEEINWKKDFCTRHFDSGAWDLDVLNQVDVLLKDRHGEPMLYIESKYQIANPQQHRQALAQLVLTNRKQLKPLAQVALIYQNAEGTDTLDLVDCSDNSVLYNNDFNWAAERPSSPTRDAVDRINDRLRGRTTTYHADEIDELYTLLKRGQAATIAITERNMSIVYNQWKQEVRFREQVPDEQDMINLFLVDILNGTRYKRSVYTDINDHTLFGAVKVGEREHESDQDLIREGTNLSHYRIMYVGDEVDGIKYQGATQSLYYTIAEPARYADFWRKYHRPPEKHEFMRILERSATLYSEQYRRDTGGEYTPACFVELQNRLLAQHYDMDRFIVFDPCAGVGNLENQFGKDYKPRCYLSTLEPMDVDICKIKGFENTVQFDYLASPDEQPLFKYKGQPLPLGEICRREGRQLMVVMNPPYQRKRPFANNLAIEFFLKAARLKPQVIVFYYQTKSFFGDEARHYVQSGYRIRAHVFSNAKTTFRLSEWPVSLVIFDRDEGEPASAASVEADRYEVERGTLVRQGTYRYDFSRPNLFAGLQEAIRRQATGMVLGNVSYLNDVIKIGNGGIDRGQHCTTGNLGLCLLFKGLIFNTHHHYFELNSTVHRGTLADVPAELRADAVMFSLFYIGLLFSNKGRRNYIMPFTADELGCGQNDLNVLFPQDAAPSLFGPEQGQEPPFDFRRWMARHSFSAEALALRQAALGIFRYYHASPLYPDRDYNDSFYDITNALMGKTADSFALPGTGRDTRISRTRTGKGTRGFGRNTVKYAVPAESLGLFNDFFDARDALARKINRQLLDAGLLLWPRENIY